jgi:hypothetical protein
MLEIAAALSAANVAFKGIKKAVEMGQDVEGIALQMGKWYSSIADLKEGCREAENPPWYAKATGDPAQLALKAVAARQAEKRMRAEIRTMLMLTHGRAVYLEFVATEKKIIRAREQEEFKRRRAKRQMQEVMIGAAILAVGIALIAGGMALLIK